ncbi:hypothetical protein FOZ60_015736 [Perkinsus olseni]|uniref:Signal peptidase complex subunit 2 n=2 Tax=Perkinsus olseni TaxID=32597 RepID=A0A7J6P6G0_PEROL|nr:hypothetical protein FOZ60_015736 [Perkinsus olseni]
MSSSAHCPHPALPPLRCDLVNDVLECMISDITEEFIRAHLKDEDTDLDKVTEITMKLNTDAHDISSIGDHLPSLSVLNLAGSYITEARSLGTRLSGLIVLNLSRSHLSDLSGMSSLLPSLQELYLAFNCLTTINGIEWMDSLQIVDLEGNSIPSIDQLSALATCSSVWQLSLEGNPVTRKASLKEILELVPALEVLDDETRVDCVCNTEAMTLTLFDLYRGRRAGSGVTQSGSLTRKVTGAEVREMCPGLDELLTSQPSDEGCSSVSELADEGSGSEPDELSLVLEETKKRAAGQARSSWGGFLSARLPFTASTTASGGDRLTRPCTRDTKPATARSLAHDSAALPSSSSVLTTGGEAFSGSPLKAIRYSKRQQRSRDEKRPPSLEEAGLSIRQLLDKKQHNNRGGSAATGNRPRVEVPHGIETRTASNLYSSYEIVKAVNEFLEEALPALGYIEDTSLPWMRILLMTLACTAGVIGQFFVKFPAESSLLKLCVLGYFFFSGVTCLVDMIWTKSSDVQINDRETGDRIFVDVEMQGFSSELVLRLRSSHPNMSEEIKESIGNFFHEDGELDGQELLTRFDVLYRRFATHRRSALKTE